MNEMVERVAAVLWSIHPGGSEWSEIKEADSPIVRRTRQQAIAAIKAMREPTETMSNAAFDVEDDRYAVHNPQEDRCAVDCWQAMIDAALKTA